MGYERVSLINMIENGTQPHSLSLSLPFCLTPFLSHSRPTHHLHSYDTLIALSKWYIFNRKGTRERKREGEQKGGREMLNRLPLEQIHILITLSDWKENKNWSEPEVWSRLSISLSFWVRVQGSVWESGTEIEMSITGPLDCPFARSINPLIGIFFHSSFSLSLFLLSASSFSLSPSVSLHSLDEFTESIKDTVTAGLVKP